MNLYKRFAIALPGLMLLCTPVLAAGDEGLMDVAISTTVWSVIIFLILLFALFKFAWGPIIKALDEREEKIKSSLEAADRALAESAERAKEHEKVLAAARREASSIVEEGKRDAQVVKDGIINDARKEAEEIAQRATAEIERAKNIALDDLHKHAVDLSMFIAGKVVQKALSAGDHEQLVRDAMSEYEQAS